MFKTLNRCYFCRHKWGSCLCKPGMYGPEEGFEFDGVTITEPMVSECGRFMVDPVDYYGEAFIKWASANRPSGPSRIVPFDGNVHIWCKEMQKRGLLYHPDDTPWDIGCEEALLFSVQECIELTRLMPLLQDADEDIYEMCLKVLEEE